MKILVAIDGSEPSKAAVCEVARRPWPEGSEVRLLTVEPPDDANVPADAEAPFSELVKEQRVEAVRRLKEATDVFQRYAPQLPVTPVLSEGWPKDVILEEAERWGADLIVLGSHGHGPIKRFFLGSVSLAVATNAPCSVEIVRIPVPQTC